VQVKDIVGPGDTGKGASSGDGSANDGVLAAKAPSTTPATLAARWRYLKAAASDPTKGVESTRESTGSMSSPVSADGCGSDMTGPEKVEGSAGDCIPAVEDAVREATSGRRFAFRKATRYLVNSDHVKRKAGRIRAVRTRLFRKENVSLEDLTASEESASVSKLGIVNRHASRIMSKLLTSGTSDALVGLLLVVNAICIGVQADYSARNEEEPMGFKVMETIFCIAFSLDLLLRMCVLGRRFFIPGEWCNWFDLFVVSLQIVDQIMLTWHGEETVVGGKSSVVRVLRILRLTRVLRLLRVFRFVTELRLMVYLLMASFSSFCWTSSLLILLIYVLAVVMTEVVADHVHSLTMPQTDSVLQAWFGSTLTSSHTLYQAIMGGFDWQDVSKPLIDEIDPVVGLVFAVYIAFAMLVVLNLVTGVFVDGAIKMSRADKEIELTSKAYRALGRTADNPDQEVTWPEFKSQMETDAMAEFFEALEISRDRAEDLFRILQPGGKVGLSIEEVVAGGLMLQGPAKTMDIAALFSYLEASLNEMNRTIIDDLTQLKLKASQSGIFFRRATPASTG